MALASLSGVQLKEKEKVCVEGLEKAFPASRQVKGDTNFELNGKTFLRFTRATGAKLTESIQRLEATLAWREEAKPFLIKSKDVAEIFKALTMRVGGRCKQGRPIFIMTLAVPNEFEVQDRINLLIYVLEVTQRKGYEQITWIIDFGEMGKHKKDDRSKEARQKTMNILQQHYPERLGLMLLYRTPWYINMLLPVVRPFMDKSTREKVCKVGGKVTDLEAFVELDQLPEFLGGTFKAVGVECLDNLPLAGGQTDVVASKPEQAMAVAEHVYEESVVEEPCEQEEEKEE